VIIQADVCRGDANTSGRDRLKLLVQKTRASDIIVLSDKLILAFPKG